MPFIEKFEKAKKIIEDLFIKRGGSILMGFIITGLSTLLVTGEVELAKLEKNYDVEYAKFLANAYDIVATDIHNNKDLSIGDSSEISIANMAFVSGKGALKSEARNDINVYGSVINKDEQGEVINQTSQSFKISYTFSEKFDVTKLKDLKKFNEGLISLSLTDMQVGQLSSLTAGLNTAKSINDFSQGLGAVNYQNVSTLKSMTINTQPDWFTPMYASVGRAEQDGKIYGVLKLDGIAYQDKTASNKLAGYLWGKTIADTTNNAEVGMLTGISMAELASINGIHTAYCEQTFVVELDATKTYTDIEIRDLIIQKIIDKDASVVAKMNYYKGEISEENIAQDVDLTK